MSENYIVARRIQVVPVGDKEEVNRVYKYFRDGCYNQNMARNIAISMYYAVDMLDNIKEEDNKEIFRSLARMTDSKKGSLYPKELEFPTGLSTPSVLKFRTEKDFKNFKKQKNKISLPTYRLDDPLLIHNKYLQLKGPNKGGFGFYHNYNSHLEFLENLYSKDLEIFIRFTNNITLKLVFGNPHKSKEIRSVFKNIFEEYYKILDSSLQIINNKIFFNLSISMPKENHKLEENTVVGVDLGVAIPAVCSLNTNDYTKLSIGSKEDFLYERTKIQSQRRRLQKALSSVGGGHGRNKKLKKLNALKKLERNWVKNYNHYVSKQIVDFAIKNKAKYINLEDLSGYNNSDFILRNWSYYELQSFIEYKADKNNIIVRKINPAYTSQTCSVCGNLEEGQRTDQAHFECKACGAKLNADYNGSRNIAKSTNFVS